MFIFIDIDYERDLAEHLKTDDESDPDTIADDRYHARVDNELTERGRAE
jgi:hypothetical protein